MTTTRPHDLAGLPAASPRIRRILAPNPSPLTHQGTNSYIIGSGRVAVIDPGPDDPRHLAALLAALDTGERVDAILVTHPHLDHSALAPRLAATTGAPVHAYGCATEGRTPLMERLAQAGLESGGDGLDLGFRPDRRMADNARLSGPDWELSALHTPGHLGSHLCLSAGAVLFSGDHVMGWSSSVVSPPDGDMGAYMASLDRLGAQDWGCFLPGHGDRIDDPATRITDLIRHRRRREAQILDALAAGPADPARLTALLYTDIPANLHPAARRNVLAHLIDLYEKNQVTACDSIHPATAFQRI